MSPNHVFIIPDGNRRSARAHDQPAAAGHQRGADTVEIIARAALERGVRFLTFWGLSIDNLQREPQELMALYQIFENYFRKLAVSPLLQEFDVRVLAIGEWKRFPVSTARAIEEVVASTASHKTNFLTFLLAYDSRNEMQEVLRALQIVPAIPMTPGTVQQHLETRELPPIDLVIRTGEENARNGYGHLSAGGILWQMQSCGCATQFSETRWPDFTAAEFNAIIDRFDTSERRLGR